MSVGENRVQTGLHLLARAYILLDEAEAFIRHNQQRMHRPDPPSLKQMVETGRLLGEIECFLAKPHWKHLF